MYSSWKVAGSVKHISQLWISNQNPVRQTIDSYDQGDTFLGTLVYPQRLHSQNTMAGL